MKENFKNEVEKAYIKIETVGIGGVSLETSGSDRGLYAKTGLILQTLILGDVVTLDELKNLIETLEELQDKNMLGKYCKEHIELTNATPEEVQKEIDEMLKREEQDYQEEPDNTTFIKRKCLVCPEKDTCKNKGIDIQCSKY